MPQPLAHKDFPFLPLYRVFQKNAERQKKNIYVIIALSQPAPKYWGWQRRQLSILSGLLTYHDNQNIYVVAVFEHHFSIKRDRKASKNACGILDFKVWCGRTSL